MESEKRFSDEKGSEYDILAKIFPNYNFIQNMLAKELKKFESKLKWEKRKFLEIGHGQGHTTHPVLKQTNADIMVVDNEELMQDYLINKINSELLIYKAANRISFYKGDANECMKIQESESFDSIYSGFTIHNFKNEKREEFRKEAYRILKPNGMFINLDKYHPENKNEFGRAFTNHILINLEFDKIGREDLRKQWLNHDFEDIFPDRIQKRETEYKAMKQEGFKKIKEIWRQDITAIVIAYK